MSKRWFLVLASVPAFSFANECTYRVSSGDPAELQSVLNVASSNGQDDVVCVEGVYNLSDALTHQLECGRRMVIRGVGKGAVLDGGDRVQILNIQGGCSSGELVISGLQFQRGKTNLDGGAISVHVLGERVQITNNVFQNNGAGFGGGAVRVRTEEGDVFLLGNIFSGNQGKLGGGASVVSTYGSIVVANNLFTYNRAEGYSGGGLYLEATYGSVSFVNNTLVGNQARLGGGFNAVVGQRIGIGKQGTKQPANALYLYNNLFYNNIAYYGGNDGDDLMVSTGLGGFVNLGHNLFTPSAKRIDFSSAPQTEKVVINTSNYNRERINGCVAFGHYGNFQANPLFVRGTFRPSRYSPAINRGCNGAPSLPQTDIEGNPRIALGVVDIGAYEFSEISINPPVVEPPRRKPPVIETPVIEQPVEPPRRKPPVVEPPRRKPPVVEPPRTEPPVIRPF